MEGGNNSYGGKSWAEQYDSYGTPEPEFAGATTSTATKTSSKTAKYKHMVGEGLGKTKVVAFIGAKKVKDGTSSGLRWVKDKYHKTTQKH